jgi:hypothetical protein
VVDSPCHTANVALDRDQRAETRAIASELAAIARSGRVLPGSIAERRTRCGRANCACHADPQRLHGPYWHWTRKVAAKTVGRWLRADQAEDYRAWIDNDRRIRELLARLEAIGVAVVESDSRTARGSRNRPGGSER